jgi:hypothetical protein
LHLKGWELSALRFVFSMANPIWPTPPINSQVLKSNLLKMQSQIENICPYKDLFVFQVIYYISSEACIFKSLDCMHAPSAFYDNFGQMMFCIMIRTGHQNFYLLAFIDLLSLIYVPLDNYVHKMRK